MVQEWMRDALVFVVFASLMLAIVVTVPSLRSTLLLTHATGFIGSGSDFVSSPASDPRSHQDPWASFRQVKFAGTCRGSPDRVILAMDGRMVGNQFTADQLYATDDEALLDAKYGPEDAAPHRRFYIREMIVWFWINYYRASHFGYPLVFVTNPGLFSKDDQRKLTNECVSFHEYSPRDASLPDKRDLFTLRVAYLNEYIRWTNFLHGSGAQGLPVRFVVHHDLDGTCHREPFQTIEHWPSDVDLVVCRLYRAFTVAKFAAGSTRAKSIVTEMQRQFDSCPIEPRFLSEDERAPKASTMLLDLFPLQFQGRADVLAPILEWMDAVSINMTAICDMGLSTLGFRHFGYWSHGHMRRRMGTQFSYQIPPLYAEGMPSSYHAIVLENQLDRDPNSKDSLQSTSPCAHAIRQSDTMEYCWRLFSTKHRGQPEVVFGRIWYTDTGVVLCGDRIPVDDPTYPPPFSIHWNE